MTDLTRSHQLIALVQASTTLPVMLLALFAGAIADNHDRRLVMLAAQVCMLIASGLLAALTWAGMIGPLSLLALTLTVGSGRKTCHKRSRSTPSPLIWRAASVRRLVAC